MEPQDRDFPSQSNKPLFPLLIALVVAALLLGYVVFFIERKITGLEVAVKTATFLDQTIEPAAVTARFVCSTSTGQCSSRVLNANTPSLSGAIYGYLKLAQVSGDDSYKIKADQVVDFLLGECRTNFQFCDWNTSVIMNYYLDTGDVKYLNAISSSAKKLLTLSNRDFIDKNAGESLALLYQATGDERYKTRLLEVADEELSEWSLSRSRLEHSIRVARSVFLPAYAVSGDTRCLDASRQLFNDFNLAENVDSNKFSLDSIISGIDALLTVSKLSDNGAMYKGQAVLALQRILYQSWDSPKSLKSNGDYGFGYAIVTDNNFVKNTTDNGWLISLFAEVSDEKFGLSTTK